MWRYSSFFFEGKYVQIYTDILVLNHGIYCNEGQNDGWKFYNCILLLYILDKDVKNSLVIWGTRLSCRNKIV